LVTKRYGDVLLSLDGTIAEVGVKILAFPSNTLWNRGDVVTVVNRNYGVLGRAECLGRVKDRWANGVLRKSTAFRVTEVVND